MKESTKIKLSLAKTGKSVTFSPQHLYRLRENAKTRRGTHLSEETKKLISEHRKGKPGWNKGLHLSESQKEKLRQARLKNPNPKDPKTGRFLKFQ